MYTLDDLNHGRTFTAASGTTITPQAITVQVGWVTTEPSAVHYRHLDHDNQPAGPMRQTTVDRFLEIIKGINGPIRG